MFLRRAPTAAADGRGRLAAEHANIDACVRCGLCLEACPTYRLTRLEEEGPRGRIAMAAALRDGNLEITDDLVAHQMSCLLCEGCTAVCPAGVKMERIGVAMREAIAAHGALPTRTRALRRALRVLGDRPRLERLVRLLGRTERLGLDRAADMLGILGRLGLSTATMPTIPDEFLPIDGGGWRPARGEPRGTVALFAGCLMSTLFAPVDVATGELLAAAGFEVRVVRGQTCCGALSAHEGDLATAAELAQINVEAFAGNDWPIVVNSAGCGAFLRDYEHHFGPRARDLAARVVDFTVLLADAQLDLSGPPPPGPVAYQDACHARLAQGIVDPPRILLDRIPGIERVELADPTLCCGSAGVYNVAHPGTAAELGHRRANTVVDSGATTVVTANPGCLLQLRNHVGTTGLDITVMHLAEVLRAACPTPVARVAGEHA